MLKVAEVSKQLVEYLSSREQPLTNHLSSIPQARDSTRQRKVSLGTIPEFTFQDDGYRLYGVTPNSPADKAGQNPGRSSR
jgi:hypothetical protein